MFFTSLWVFKLTISFNSWHAPNKKGRTSQGKVFW